MEPLTPGWKQERPTFTEVKEMCGRIHLQPASLPASPFDKFLDQIRKSHDNGGACLVAFHAGSDPVFDWFASRNRLADEQLFDSLFQHPAIRRALPDLLIPTSSRPESGLKYSDQFAFDGTIASKLYFGGAYGKAHGDGRSEKTFALEVCDAMFGLRYGEISCYLSYEAWTPWFKGIAWDFTAVVFDRRTRKLWILAITDTD
jgi:hypothetical protein